MTETVKLGLPEAARQLGVPVRVLRRAIRTGTIPTPPQLSATVVLSAEWLASAKAAVEAQPKALHHIFPQKVPPFARYEGTSAWRKYSIRVREYEDFRAAAGLPTP